MSNLVNDKKRLVAAFLQFLDIELKSEGIAHDTEESLEVAKQCLQMAYDTSALDVPQSQEKLLNIFTANYSSLPEKKILTAQETEEAELLKLKGNEFMKIEDYDGAIDCYSKAIAIDGNNAVFYCNRAAAYTGKEMFDLSLSDCNKSLEIDPNYSKAHSRMGLTYSKMEYFNDAIVCYQKALKLDPSNEGYKKNLQIAEEKLKLKQVTQDPTILPSEGFPDINNIFSNPTFLNMAKQVAQNPEMQEMAMKLIGGLSANSGASSGPSSSDNTDHITEILQIGQQFAQQFSGQNPDLIEQLRKKMPRDDGDKPDADDQS